MSAPASYGLSFDSAVSFAEMFERLNAIGPWTWYERDSAWFGNIAATRTPSLMLDLYESGANEIEGGSVAAGNGQQFAISVRSRREQPMPADDWAALEVRIRTEILPALGATRVQPTEPID